MTYSEADTDSDGTLSEAELNALTVAQLKAIAKEKASGHGGSEEGLQRFHRQGEKSIQKTGAYLSKTARTPTCVSDS